MLMLKKIAKTLDEMSKNEELMAGIIAAAEDDMGGAGEDMNGGEDENDAYAQDYDDDDGADQQ